jgi:predicted ABC-type ATPase
MISFKEFLSEGINDKGIFKAIFILGIPGSGKSYTIKRLRGTVSPVVVNTDKATEYLTSKLKVSATSSTWDLFRDTAHRMTKKQLHNYVNSMLPLFIDGTSNDASNILHRAGILESLGYDVGYVVISSDVDTAIARTKARAEKIGREVDEEFIRQVHERNAENIAYFRNKGSFFRMIDNDGDGSMDDDEFMKAFKLTQGFFASPVDNPIGKRTIQALVNSKEKYLVPSITSHQTLENKIEGWYKQ